jgi:hypothetical protein
LSLGLKRFHIGERGNLYDRLTLNFQFHLKDKDTSLKFCELALADVLVPDKYKLMIQDRAMRLSKEFEAKIELEKWETVSNTFVNLNFFVFRIKSLAMF